MPAEKAFLDWEIRQRRGDEGRIRSTLEGIATLAERAQQKTTLLGATRMRTLQGELDRSRAGLLSMSSAVGGLQAQMGRLGAALGFSFGTATLVRGLRDAIAVGAEYADRMQAVAAVSRATAAEMATLRGEARKLGETTRFTAGQASEAMEVLARAGFSVAETSAIVPEALDLASAGALSLRDAAFVTAQVIKSFRLETGEATRVVDVLARTAASSNTDVTGIGEALRFVGPIAAGLKIPVEDTAAALGVLSNNGLVAGMAGTGLRRVLSELANATGPAQKIIRGLGLTMEEVNPATNDLATILRRLHDAGLTAAEALAIAGDRGGPALEVLAQSIPELERLQVAVRDTETSAKQMATTMEDSLAGTGRLVKSAAESAQIALVEGLTPALRSTGEDLAAFLRGSTEEANALGQALGPILKITAALLTLAALGSSGQLGPKIGKGIVDEWERLSNLFGNFRLPDFSSFPAFLGSLRQASGVAEDLAGATIRVAVAQRFRADATSKAADETDFQAALDREWAKTLGEVTKRQRELDDEEKRRLQRIAQTKDGLEEQIQREIILLNALGKGAKAEAAAAIEIAKRTAALQAGLAPGSAAAASIENLAEAHEILKQRVEQSRAELTAFAKAQQAMADLGDEILARMEQRPDADATRRLVQLEAEAAASQRLYDAAKAGIEVYREQLIQEQLLETARQLGIDSETELGKAMLKRVEASLRTVAATKDAEGALKDYGAAAAGVAESWLSALASIAEGLDDSTARALRSAAQIAAAYQQLARIRQQQGGNGYSAEGIAAGYQTGQGVGQMGIQYGAWQGDLGTSQFGGSRGGDFGDTGAEIGGAIGSYWGPVGALIGGAIGGILGGAISRGVDEARVTVEGFEGRASREIQSLDSELLPAIAALGDGVANGINGMVARLGAELISLPLVDLFISGDTISLTVGAVRKQFTDMGAAVDAAIIEGLRQAELGGLSPEVTATLQHTAATTMDQLFSDLDFARYAERLRIGDTAADMRDLAMSMEAARARAEALGISTEAFYGSELDQLRQLRDQLVGVERDEYQERLARASDFTAEIARRREEAEAEIARLLEQMAAAVHDQTLTDSMSGLIGSLRDGVIPDLGAFFGEVMQQFIGFEAAGGSLLQATGLSVEQLQAKLDGLRAFLEGLDGLGIDPGEIRKKPRGGNRAAEREQYADRLEDIIDSGLPDLVGSLEATRKEIERIAAEGARLGIDASQAVAVMTGHLQAAAQDAFLTLAERMAEAAGDEETLTELAQIRWDLERAEMALQIEMLGEMGFLQKEQIVRLRQLYDNLPTTAPGTTPGGPPVAETDPLGALGAVGIDIGGILSQLDAIERATQILDDFANITMESDQGLIDLMNRLNGLSEEARKFAADSMFLSFGDALLGFVDRYYGQTAEGEALRMQLEQVRFHLELANLNAQFQLLQGLGLLTEAQIAIVGEALGWLNDPNNWPDFTLPRIDPRSTQGVGGGLDSAADDLERIRQQIFDQIQAWEDLALSPNERRLAELNRRIEEMNQLALEAGLSASEMARLQAAAQIAIEDFWRGVTDPIRDFYDSLGLSQFSPAGGQERLAAAQSEFESLSARLAANPHDLQALEQIQAAAQAYLTEAQAFTGGSGPLYNRIFGQVQALLAQILGISIGGGAGLDPGRDGAGGLSSEYGNLIGGAHLFGQGNAPPPFADPVYDPQAMREAVAEPIVAELRVVTDRLIRVEGELRGIRRPVEEVAESADRTARATTGHRDDDRKRQRSAEQLQRDIAVAAAAAKRQPTDRRKAG